MFFGHSLFIVAVKRWGREAVREEMMKGYLVCGREARRQGVGILILFGCAVDEERRMVGKRSMRAELVKSKTWKVEEVEERIGRMAAMWNERRTGI